MATQNLVTRSPLLALPTEILLILLYHLAVTSRVYLALTCKHFAKLLSETYGILSFGKENISLHIIELCKEDETFRCWALDTSKFYRTPIFSLKGPRIYRIGKYEYTLRCNHCITLAEYAELKLDVVSQIHQHRRSFENFLTKHTAKHTSVDCGRRLVTRGMVQLMTDVYVPYIIKKQNRKWAKAAFFYWIMGGERELIS